LKEDGTLDRTKLGFIVFQDEEQRRKLNAIVHPAVRSAMILRILKYWLRGERVCVLDVPLLIESKIYQWVGKVVVVYWFVPFESHMTGSLMTGCEQLCRNTAAATHAAGWIDARGRTSAITGAASYRRQTRVC
jgi:Dephospho-CoA kinase